VLGKIIFSDEYYIEEDRGKKKRWSWDDLETFLKRKQATIMVWGAVCEAFTRSHRYQSVLMKRVPTAKRG
jgi:hypothetical protein